MQALQANAAAAQTSAREYEERFVVTGALLRAGIVCGWHAKYVNEAMAPIAMPELRSIAIAYPKTIERWMVDGATTFNSQAMQMGSRYRMIIQSPGASSSADEHL
jgi:hypothetical protein